MTKKEWCAAHSSWNKDDGTWFNPIPILQGGSTPTPPIQDQPISQQMYIMVYTSLGNLG